MDNKKKQQQSANQFVARQLGSGTVQRAQRANNSGNLRRARTAGQFANFQNRYAAQFTFPNSGRLAADGSELEQFVSQRLGNRGGQMRARQILNADRFTRAYQAEQQRRAQAMAAAQAAPEGAFTAGSTDQVNQRVNDYQAQVQDFKDKRARANDLNTEKWDLELQNSNLSATDPVRAKNDTRIAEIDSELESIGPVEKPERPYLNPRDFANESASGADSQVQAGTWQEAAQLQQQMEKEQKYWDDAQKRYQPDSRDYAQAKARYDNRYAEYSERYNTLVSQLDGSAALNEKKTAQEERKNNIVQELQAIYDDIDERFAGANPDTNEEYQAVLRDAEQLQNELNQLETDSKRLEYDIRLNERTPKTQQYEIYRYQEGFQETAEAGMRDGLEKQDDRLSVYLANREALDASADSEVQLNGYAFLSDSEVEMYYFLRNRYGDGEAKQYLDSLKITLDKRRTEFDDANREIQYGTANTAGKIGMNALSVPASVVGGISSAVSDVGNAITGNFSPYSQGHTLSNYANTVRGMTTQEIVDSIDSPFWKDIAAMTYNGLMSGADSALGGVLFGRGYDIVTGLSAASQRAQELYEKGASAEQVAIGAIASGAIEMASEHYSVEYFTSRFLEGNITGFGDWLKKTLIQAFNEGSEEVVSDVANLIVDSMIEGAGSDYQDSIRELMEQGLSEEEAKKQAFTNQVVDTFWSFYSGAVSGGAMGGIGGVINATTSDARQNGKNIIESGRANEVLDTALELRPDDKMTKYLLQLQEQGKLGHRGSDYAKLTDVQQRNTADLTGRDAENIRNAVQQRAQTLGVTKNTEDVASAIVKQLTGDKLTMTERYALAMNKNTATQILSELDAGINNNTDTDSSIDSAWVRDVGTYNIAPAVFGRRQTKTEAAAQAEVQRQIDEVTQSVFGADANAVGQLYQPGQSRADYVQDMVKMYRAGQEGTPYESVTANSLFDAQKMWAYDAGAESVSGESYDFDNLAKGQSFTISDNSPVNIAGIESVSGGNLVLRTDDGSTVDAKNVKFGDYGTARLYKVIADMGVDAEMGNRILDAAKSSRLSASAYAIGVREAFDAGRNGVSLDSLSRDSHAMRMDEETRKAAWEAGRESKKASVQQKQEAVDSGKHGVKRDGLTVEDSAGKITELNEQQRSGMDAAKLLAEMGLDVTVYASTEADRKAGMENGNIRLSDGSIRVDLNAGADGQGVMAFALSHELTHFVEEMSPKKFQAFTDILFEEMGKNGTDVSALIEAKADALGKMEENKSLSENKLNDLAYSEVTAEMMETALADTDVMERISARLQQTDKSLWGKIKDFLKGLVDRLKAAYKGLNPDSGIAQLARETINSSERVLDAFADAASDAVVNYRLQDGSAQTNMPNGTEAAQNVQLVQDDQQGLQENGNPETRNRDGIFTINKDGSVEFTDGLPKDADTLKGFRAKGVLKFFDLELNGQILDIADGMPVEKFRVQNVKKRPAVKWDGASYSVAEKGILVLQDGQKNNAAEGVMKSQRQSGQTNYDFTKPFAEQVDDWIGGKFPKNDTLLVGTTPKVFKDVGFNSLPVTLNQSHVDYAINGTKNADHTIGATLLKQLPQALENPVAIIASATHGKTSTVALLPFTVNGSTVIAPVYVDGFGYQNSIQIDSNAVTSIYGRKNAVTTLLTDAINEQNNGGTAVFYLDTKKAAALYSVARVTMPKMPSTSRNGVVAMITDSGSPVKTKFSNVTESQQFKRWFGDWQNDPAHASKVVNEDGTPKVVYHQTDADFTIFEPRHEGAGTRDSDTPFGIFLKSSDKNIGLKGNKQMALYADIKNPLTVRNREQLIHELQKISDGYATALAEHQALDAQYKQKTDNAIRELREYMVQWRKDNPDASRTALYDDSRFNQLFDAEDNLTDEWESKAREIELRSKEAITRDLEAAGYDGVIIQQDAGSFGRSTDAYIALHPEQVKSATDNIGTFDSSNPDIRYSSRQRAEVEQALDEYRAQQNEEFRTMKAAYDTARAKIAQEYKLEMEQMESLSGEITARYQNEFLDALMDTEDLGKKGIPQLRKQFRELAEKNSGKDAQALSARKAEYNRLLDEFQKNRDIGKLRVTIQQQRSRAKAKVENSRKTVQRGKLERTVAEINRRLLNPSKTLYVPDSLQPAVTMAMEAITTVRQQDTKAAGVLSALDRLQDAYKALTEANAGTFTQEYNEGILDYIDAAKEAIGETKYHEMSLEQLKAVTDAYTGILTAIRNANKMHAANLTQGYLATAQAAMEELKGKPSKVKTVGELKKTLEQASWNNEKPYYAFQRLGSDTMMRLYQNLRRGEDGWARDFAQARAYAMEAMRKYNYDKWKDSLVEIETADGQKVALNLEERLSLYAYSRRDQAINHLTGGGFMLTDSKRNGKSYNDYTAYKLSQEAVLEIRNGGLLELTAEQLAFANEMQQYLSTVCAEQNNEVSRALYGISKAKEEFYWPIKASSIRSERIRNAQEFTGNKQKNAGHMKSTNKNASNTIELSGFMNTWADHVNATAMYHNFALPMEDFYRVYNYTVGLDGLRQQMSSKLGEASVNYVDQLLKDLNGGLRADPRESAFNKLLSGFKKRAVVNSMSVAIQQPSAVGRAFAIIDPKYFFGLKVEKAGGINATWAEMQQYAPVVTLKDIGRFDTDMGLSTRELLSGEKGGLLAKLDELGTKAPEFMDKITWVAMWEAAKRQVKARGTGLTGDALKTEAAKLFTQCITQTQVYDSVFSRSGNMRSKSGLMKMATAFMAEPTTTINMVESAIRDARSGRGKIAARKMASVTTAIVLNSILAAIVYAARDDDEEKTYLEKYMNSLTSEMIDGFNPLGYFPGIKDIWSIMQGYDVERSDMNMFSTGWKAVGKMTKAWETFANTDEEDEEGRKAALRDFGVKSLDAASILGDIGNIGLKNILREGKAVVNTVKTFTTPRYSDKRTMGYAIWQGWQENLPSIFRAKDSKTERLYGAVVSGSDAMLNRLKDTYSDDKKFQNAIITALQSEDGRITQAAKAKASGDGKTAQKLLQEIAAEGHFTLEQAQKAMEKQLNKTKGGTKTSIQEMFQNDELSKQEAISKLQTVTGASKSDAEETVQQWTAKKSTGIEYSETKDAYLTGEITGSKAEDILVRYGGKKAEDAKQTVKEWGCKKDLNIEYSQLKDAYFDGKVTEQTMKNALVRYGGKSQEEAAEAMTVYTWQKQNPKYDWSYSQVLGYVKEMDEIGTSAKALGIQPDTWQKYKEQIKSCTGVDANGDGKIDNGSVREQVLKLIDSLPLSAAQKDALYYANGYSTRTLYKAPWH